MPISSLPRAWNVPIGVAGKTERAALQHDQFARKETLPAGGAQRAGGDDVAVVEGLMLDVLHVDFDGRVLQVPRLPLGDTELAQTQPLPARSVVIAEQSMSIRQQAVQLASPIQFRQLLMKPVPAWLIIQQVVALGELLQERTEQMLRIGAAERPKSPQRQFVKVRQRPVLSEAEFPRGKFSAERMRVGASRRTSRRLMSHMGDIQPRIQAVIVFQELRERTLPPLQRLLDDG